MIIDYDDVVVCPHCGKKNDDFGSTAQEFVIYGRVGEASRATHECIWCYGEFSAVRTTDDKIIIEV